ncbi:Protein transport protein S9 plasma membrane t-SNARE [Scheffersomyces spartinae]|uniref:Protein transport protein S9 plasma membrane t-SNARE n=1 Tax=Scheffersomyces spartinae TaxID=45513 RepID=A0A9P8AGK7_9ASCO|nr:Protein transport protein S9 plasma membrane t-SNARE [Scheffersomyces spartinae]KAG7191711.1 Protein transport protein S9 plasma membrane t-SNARE [Scheffersomyces spartinae]
MGLKRVFKKKEPAEEVIQRPKHREEKFGAFKEYAQEKQARKPGLQPVNPYANIGAQNGGGANPYANNDNNNESTSNPYSGNANTSNPYGGNASNPYGGNNGAMNGGQPQRLNLGQTATFASSSSNPYANAKPYQPPSSNRTSTSRSTGGRSTRVNEFNDDESTLDLNDIPSNPMQSKNRPVNRKPKTPYDPNELNFNLLDLNQEDPEDDLNLDVLDVPSEEEQVNSEDEEVDRIKQDIRFVKQESLQLTVNTLRMAQEADAGATNTLGMLGSQSERLYNVEQNLLLSNTQTKLADSKVDELRRLNRSIFVPTYTPFTKKKRYEAAEQKLKAQLATEKYTRDRNRSGMYESEQRVKQGLSSNSTSSETYRSYRDQQHLEAAQRYQIEPDSEDDEMEKQIGNNLDQIGNYAKKLNSTAKLIGLELDSQSERLKKIEEDSDRLDIDVHLNTSRLKNIR